MNELLQKHGCSNVFSVPEGLKELMSDISREVLRMQPSKLLDFIANYLSALLITREHGILALKILEDLCDCQVTVSEHLLQIGLEREDAEDLSQIIKTYVEDSEMVEGKEKLREYQLLLKILNRKPMDEELSAKVCQVARNAYKDYWYRRNLLKQGLKKHEEEPWEIAAMNTLNLYKKTKPSMIELHRATSKVQAAYRAYHVRREVLKHLMPKKDKKGRKVDLSGPPLDIAESRDSRLGPVIDIRTIVPDENVTEIFDKQLSTGLGLEYDPAKTLTHVESEFLHEKVKKGVKLAEGPAKVKSSTQDDEDDHVDAHRQSWGHSAPRISFSQNEPEVIDDTVAGTESKVMEAPAEIPEDISTTLVSDEAYTMVEDYQEIPEDLPEFTVTDMTGTSGPDTDPEFTDVEDVEDAAV